MSARAEAAAPRARGVAPNDAVQLTDAGAANADTWACLQVMRAGSRTFFMAARLLPQALLHDFAAIYAFCRQADDAIDEAPDPSSALQRLHARLAQVQAAAAGTAELSYTAPSPPLTPATERALARTLRTRKLGVAPLYALLDGFAWDARGRDYRHLDDTLGYAARAAGSVGVLLAQLMGAHAPWALARAADMGVAMQLTNICRDVGEDARRGRIYLPRRWLDAAGVDPTTLGTTPQFTPALGRVVARMLALADKIYARAREGLGALPLGPSFAVAAAQRFYADIGRSIAARNYDAIHHRAVVGTPRKLLLAGRALVDVPRARLAKGRPQRLRGPLRSSAFLLAAPPEPVTREA